MFGINPWTIIGVASAIVLSFGGGIATGYKIEKANFEAYKVEQAQLTRQKEKESQDATDAIREAKDAEIASINNKLFDALVELRKRPARPAKISENGQSGTGATLYSEDAIFLTREAARADIIRTALQACYQQYDEVTK